MNLFALVILIFALYHQLYAIEYISPLPNSSNNSISEQIIIRFKQSIDINSINNDAVIVKDANGNLVEGNIKLASDGKTLLYQPLKKLAYNTNFHVTLNPVIKSNSGNIIPGFDFSFSTMRELTISQLNLINLQNENITNEFENEFIQSGELPDDFPLVTVLQRNNPAPGVILMTNRGPGYGFYLIMLDSAGSVIKYKKMDRLISNFTIQKNGLITYNKQQRAFFKAWSHARVYIADTSFNPIDSIDNVEDLFPSVHVSVILPNGHYLFTSYEGYNVDMSKVIEGGNPNALVAGAILYELDADKNVIFKWRSWDHIPVLDSYQPLKDYLNITTLYSNFNSVDIDHDGNFLLCNRLLSEILKINRNTGEIIWRLGGKHNDFAFINERPEYLDMPFSMQHDIRFLPNGNVTIFDNGDQHDPPQSRAIEYKLDEDNMTATLVWEHISDHLLFATSTGSAHRLPNGNTAVGWGTIPANPKRDYVEIAPDGTIELELALPENISSFKAEKHKYPIGSKEASVRLFELKPLNTYTFESGNRKTGIKLVFPYLDAFVYNSVTVDKYHYAPKYPRFEGPAPHVLPYSIVIVPSSIDSMNASLSFLIDEFEWIKYPERTKVFYRPKRDAGQFTELPTVFNSSLNELIASTSEFGEFILAVPDDNNAVPFKPWLFTPKNNTNFTNSLPVELFWSIQGQYLTTDLQVANDYEFNDLILDTTGIKFPKITLDIFQSNKSYYWRARAVNKFGASEWTGPWHFSFAEPFIKIINPKQDDVIEVSKATTSYIVYWEDNFNEKVKIEQTNSNNFYKVLADSFETNTNAFLWQMNDSIPEDETYKLVITVLNNDNLQAESDYFTIKHSTTDIAENLSELSSPAIFPNPALNYINIKFNINQTEKADLLIYNSMGNLVKKISFGELSPGAYHTGLDTKELNNGSYYLLIKTTSRTIQNKFIIIR